MDANRVLEENADKFLSVNSFNENGRIIKAELTILLIRDRRF
jgi:hypothetical protein